MKRPVLTLLTVAVVTVYGLGLAVLAQGTRIVRGQVLDPGGKAREGALVHLVEKKSGKEVTITSQKEGRYQFNTVDRQKDYRLFATYEELRSRDHGVSSLVVRDPLVINLRLREQEEGR